MQRQPKLSIVIPAFNQAVKIQRDIREAHTFLIYTLVESGEIIVVDDGSSDETPTQGRERHRYRV